MMTIIIAFILCLTSVLGEDVKSLVLTGTVYDFRADYNDFEGGICGLTAGLVQNYLSDDRKPVLKDKKNCISSEENFNKWFRKSDNNIKIEGIVLPANWDYSKKAYVYYSPNFFPINQQGFGTEGRIYNYHFCMEMHSSFTYQGGETYWFEGDDDVWVFINEKLQIDLGGVHGPAQGSVSLDSLGLTVGSTYNFDFFFCERHTSGSNLGFTTTIKLDPCGTVDSDKDFAMDLCDPCPSGDVHLSIGDEKVIGYQVTLPIYLNTGPLKNDIAVEVDWGDNKETISLRRDSEISHTYSKTGNYKIKVSASAPYCGSSEDSTEVKIGNRIAPSCANRVVLPLS